MILHPSMISRAQLPSRYSYQISVCSMNLAPWSQVCCWCRFVQGDLDAVDMPTGILLVKVIEATDIPNMVRPAMFTTVSIHDRDLP